MPQPKTFGGCRSGILIRLSIPPSRQVGDLFFHLSIGSWPLQVLWFNTLAF